MKKKFSFLLLLVCNNFLFAQYKIDYEYIITAQFPGNTSIAKVNSFLITDGIFSRFVKNRVFNGAEDAKFENSIKELEENANSRNKYSKGDSIGYVIGKDFKKDSIYMRVFDAKLGYTKIPRKMMSFAFKIMEEYKIILNYKCQKALLDFENRQFEIWFTTDIPISDGPWLFQGLPGLILEAKTTDNFHQYVATRIQKTKQLDAKSILFPFEQRVDLTTYQKKYLELEEKKFKFGQSQGDTNVKYTVKINNLDIPFTIFE